MPPDLERYHVVWWRPGWATAFDSVINENGQRGINIPTNCKYVQVRYGQIKSTLFARLERIPPHLEGTEIHAEAAFEIPGSWMSGALLASNEVESVDGVIGFGQNISNSTFNLLSWPYEEHDAIGLPGWIKTINFPSWENGSIYRLRDGYSKFRPYWMVPQSYNLFSFMTRGSDIGDAGGTNKLPATTPFEVSSWGNFKPFDGQSYIHVLQNYEEAFDGSGWQFTNSLHEVMGYRCYQTLDYLVELRFYEEKEE